MADTLPKLFGSQARVKLLRLFLFNPNQSFTQADAAARAQVSSEDARREFTLFARIHLILRANRGKGVRYKLDTNFAYVSALQNLLLNSPTRTQDMLERLRTVGQIKLVILSGIFMGEWGQRLDVLVIGDKIHERKLRDTMRTLEADIGREIHYAFLPSADFLYRINMNDKLLRDVLDYPHTVVLDKLHVGVK